MENNDFIFVKHFRIDILEFDLLKSRTSEQYKTISTYTDGGEGEETIYADFEQLCGIFEDDLSPNELK